MEKEGTKSEGKNPFQGKNLDFTGECCSLSCLDQSLSRVTGKGQQAGNSPSESQLGVLLSFLGLSFPGHPDSQPREAGAGKMKAYHQSLPPPGPSHIYMERKTHVMPTGKGEMFEYPK